MGNVHSGLFHCRRPREIPSTAPAHRAFVEATVAALSAVDAISFPSSATVCHGRGTGCTELTRVRSDSPRGGGDASNFGTSEDRCRSAAQFGGVPRQRGRGPFESDTRRQQVSTLIAARVRQHDVRRKTRATITRLSWIGISLTISWEHISRPRRTRQNELRLFGKVPGARQLRRRQDELPLSVHRRHLQL